MKRTLLLLIIAICLYSCNKNESPNLIVKKWVAVGNSITWHPINNNWAGEWGMAATSIENDYVHILNQNFKNNFDSVSFKIDWAVDWETNHPNYDLSYFDKFFDGDEDLVVIRLGENVKDTTNFEADFRHLIQHLKHLSPNAKFVITGIFMSDSNDLKYKETIQKKIAKSENCIWVPINQLDTKENRNFIGNTVNGRTIENQAVADHPGDKGMEAIAEVIFESLQKKGKSILTLSAIR
ncbi:MAG: SGNH/GDSL hydrolase family protein [Prevotella sp.]|nr:SGNH/GDSL hydrolase family protein [Prevotella sp.]